MRSIVPGTFTVACSNPKTSKLVGSVVSGMDTGWAAGIYGAQTSQGRADLPNCGPAVQQRKQTLEGKQADRPEPEAGINQTESSKQFCEQVVRDLREVLLTAKDIHLKKRFVDEPISSEALLRVQRYSNLAVPTTESSRYILTSCHLVEPGCDSLCAGQSLKSQSQFG